MEEIEEIICKVLMDYGFDDKYIKYSSYKYKLFSNCISGMEDDYKSICDGMNLYFDRKEEEALFKILGLNGYNVKSFENYYFYKRK